MRSDFSKAFLSAVNYLPDKLWRAAFSLSPDQRAECEEVRLRVGRPPKALVGGKYITLTSSGEIVVVTADDVSEILERATGHSVHTYSSQIASGFITTPEGHRLGIAGECYTVGDQVQTIRNISCLNLRISKPHIRLADKLVEKLYHNGFASTLIISPPGGGKTSLLRDMSRVLSRKYSVSIVDERYEIGGCIKACRYNDIGDCDVISGISKSAGIDAVMRSMSPQIIALDEITQEQDVESICKTAYCGCAFLVTAHANCPEDLNQRPIYRKLMNSNLFDVVIRIDNQKGKRYYTAYIKESECSVENHRNIADSCILLGNRFFAEQEL